MPAAISTPPNSKSSHASLRDPGDRRVDPHHLLDGLVAELGASREQLPLIRVAQERLEREPELVAGRVHPAEHQQHERDAELVGREPVLAVMRLDERADEVVAQLAAAIGDQLVGVPVEAGERGLDPVELGRDVDGEPEAEVPRPGRDRRPRALGQAEDRRDHATGVRLGELVHELAAAALGERLDQLVGEGLEARDEAVDRARVEGRVEQSPQPAMFVALEIEQRARPPIDERPAVDAVVGGPGGAPLAQAPVLEQLVDLGRAQDCEPVVRSRVPIPLTRLVDPLGADREGRIRDVEVRDGHERTIGGATGGLATAPAGTLRA